MTSRAVLSQGETGELERRLLLHSTHIDPLTLERRKQEYWRRKYGSSISTCKKLLIALFAIVLLATLVLLFILLSEIFSIGESFRIFFALLAAIQHQQQNATHPKQ
ncbi:hypothetical protein CSKR_203652 [Clonorchis sinensis]|uniref:Uncharacterized protein n=1 Tax=Clonorchis sinensis TaxID=79923 RepID=A0A8T1N053_CLOSI|nr:hypothetical protein CSKR_203652 [Clonorchis sinensis]